MNWEQIEGNMSRAKVPFGWLVMVVDEVHVPMNKGYQVPEPETGYEWRHSITYVFDPFKKWKL